MLERTWTLLCQFVLIGNFRRRLARELLVLVGVGVGVVVVVVVVVVAVVVVVVGAAAVVSR